MPTVNGILDYCRLFLRRSSIFKPWLGRSAGEGIGYPLWYSWVSLVVQLVKNSPAMPETWVRSLDWEDPLKRERLPTPVFWPGEFHGRYSPMELQRVGQD